MSFSVDVKTELCRAPLSRKCCAQAEAYGVLLYCNTFHAAQARIVTENGAFAQRLPALLKKAFRLTFDRLPEGGGKRVFTLDDPAKLEAIHQAFGGHPRALALHLNFAVVEEPCCRSAFLRGAFLAGGSVTDPRKGYHLELATSHHSVSREVLALMRELDQEPKSAQRKGNAVIYFKQSEKIEDFLTCVGAPLAAMEVMNAKLERDLRGKVNRRVNCDAANLDKAVEAAMPAHFPGRVRGQRGRGRGAHHPARQAPGGGRPAPDPPGGHPGPAGRAVRPAHHQVRPQPQAA